MARLLTPGSKVGRFVVEEHLYTGRDALSYRARDGFEAVFLKQYKSPSVLVPWYGAYRSYQRDLAARLNAASGPWIAPRASFETTIGVPTFFQAFAFLGCRDLERRLGSPPPDDGPARRLRLAEGLVAAVRLLHERGIVHADLKPANVLLPPEGGPLLADFDFSLIRGVVAPWHGHQGYLGSPLYYSPEHVRDETPRPESDVYACGLMLYELLDGAHPYRFENGDAYLRAMLGFEAPLPALSGFAGGDFGPVRRCLRACLSPVPEERPRLGELAERLALLHTAGEAVPVRPQAAPRAVSEPCAACGLRLDGEERGSLCVRIRSDVGRALLACFGEEARYAGRRQFTLHPGPEGWRIEPDPAAVNDTIVNGERLDAPRSLRDGDVIGIGRHDKGLFFLPVHVHFLPI